MFMHKSWSKTDLLEKWKAQSVQRNLKDLTVGPVLTWNNEQIKKHQDAILELDGAKLLWGGEPLPKNTIPS